MARGNLIRTIIVLVTLAISVLWPSGRALPDYSHPRERFIHASMGTSAAYHSSLDTNILAFIKTPQEAYWGVTPSHSNAHSPYTPSEYDIPLELNDTIWQQLLRMQKTNGRGVKVCLERGGFYMGRMKQILWEEGCPSDMVFLAMIESGFSPTARSQVDAAGPWQFMASTGRNYDLKVTAWVDERLDYEKSTHAAGRHLMDLYAQFESWPLVLAAYNAGPGTVQRAIRRRDTKDFWELAKSNDFRPETKAFVPRFYATMIFGKHPDRFGLENLDPLEGPYSVPIKVGPLTDLATVSKISGAPREQLRNLNAQYLYGCTPPFSGSWIIRVPKRYAMNLQDKMDSLKPEERNQFTRYKVRKGEKLSTLARKYHLPSSIILEANGLKSASGIKRDMMLTIPNGDTGPPPPQVVSEPRVTQTASGHYQIKYVVGDGDTLWKIAQKANVSIEDICKWNKIKKEDYLYPGQTLALYCTSPDTARNVAVEGQTNRRMALSGPSSFQTLYHTVRSGESLSVIAKKYDVSTQNLISWNKLKPPHRVRAGQKLKIYR